MFFTVGKSPNLMANPHQQSLIMNETNIARYFARLLKPGYDSLDILQATEIDALVDLAPAILHGSVKERDAVLKTVNNKLGPKTWLVGNEMSLADIVLWSSVLQSKHNFSGFQNIQNWIKTCNQHPAFQCALGLMNLN